MTNIITKVRALIDDIEQSDKEIFIYRTEDTFTLSQTNILSIVKVKLNGTELGSGDYIWYPSTNEITITTSLSTKDVIDVYYTAYFDYSDTELIEYIRGALVHISFNGYSTFSIESGNVINPIPTTIEEDLIAVISSILIKPDYASYRLPNIAVTYERKEMDVDEKISTFINKFKTVGKNWEVFKNIEILDTYYYEE